MGGVNKKMLNEAQGTWEEAETPEGNQFGDLPDGKYRGELVEAKLDSREVDDEKVAQLCLQWKILGPTHEGRRTFQNFGLTNTKGCEIAKGTLAILGVEIPKKLDKLPPLLAEIEGAVVELNLKTGKPSKTTGKKYQNTYVNKLLSGDDAEGTDTAEDVEQDLSEMDLEDQQVTFEDDDGNDVVGKVTEQDGSKLTVEDEDGGEWTVDTEDVTLVDSDSGDADEEASWSKGDRVTAEIDGETYAGKIVKLDEDEETATVKFDDGDKQDIALDELSAEEDAEAEDAEAEEGAESEAAEDADGDVEYIGKSVTFEADDEEYTGKVIADDNDGNVTVLDEAGEEWNMEYADVTIVEGEDAEEGTEEAEVEEPKKGPKKSTKKGAKKKAAKKKAKTAKKKAGAGRKKTAKKSGKAKKKAKKKKARRV